VVEGSGTATESTAAARAQDGEQTAAAWRAMPMSALRKLAKGAGVGPSELRAAKDSKRPKDVLIDLLRAAGAGSEEAVQAAAQPAEPASTDDVAAAAAAPATAKAGAAADRAFLSEWPFDTDYGDHYETPLRAYHDVRPLLRQVARDAGVSRGKVRVSVGRGVCQLGGACVSWAGRVSVGRGVVCQCRLYDPYYCRGAASRHLASLGFEKLINKKRDFYADVAAGTTPRHHALLTNPPYSGACSRAHSACPPCDDRFCLNGYQRSPTLTNGALDGRGAGVHTRHAGMPLAARCVSADGDARGR
jgi:hypothetical protein